MAHRRQPYGGWRDHGRRGADNDDYEAPNQRAAYDRYPSHQRSAHADDQPSNQRTELVHDRHLPNQRAVYAHQPSSQQAVYPHQPSERKKNNDYDKEDDDNNDEKEEKADEETISEKAQPNAPANKYVGGYGTAYNRPDQDNSSNRYRDYRNNERTTHSNRWADSRGGAGVGYSAGYGHNYNNGKNAAAVVADDGVDNDDEEQMRKEFANRFTLSPRRQHVVEKKAGEASHGQPNVMVVKEMKLYLEHNKIENFAWNKREKGGKAKKTG